MYILFFIWLLIAIPAGILHFQSVEYEKIEKKYGKEKAVKISKLYGAVSADLEMLFLIGLWVLPQQRFRIKLFSNWFFEIPIINFSIPYLHLIVSLPFIVIGGWFILSAYRIMGKELSAEHKKPEKVITEGIFSIVRHPQNLGGAILHIGMCIALSAWYALLFTPVFLTFDYLVARKEEKELLRTFGKEYEEYKRNVSMFIPRFGRQF
jgi:protein-S-isoprenylcysteine O-methyltransferase Ste14